MPKLLQINVTANWGSTGKIAEQIGLAAMDAGWESYIAYGRDFNKSESKLIQIGNKLSVYLHLLQARLLDRAGLGSWFATKRLIKEIDHIKPDIIHLHNIHGYVLNYKLLFKYLNASRIPVVWSFHDFWAMTGHCAYFYSCDKWKSGCGACEQYHDYPCSMIDNSKNNYRKKLSSFRDTNLNIVAVSSWMKSFVEGSFLNIHKISVIPNGVNLKVFRPFYKYTDFNFRVSDYIILGVAIKWDERKGFADYLELSNYLRPDEKIVLVGLSDEQIATLPSNIIGIKKTDSQEQLAQLYSRADVVLSLSYAETFGLTIAEGMACGTPVVAYDNTAQSDLITDDTGIKVPTGDVALVYRAISTVRELGKEHYRKACRTRAEEHFDKDKCFRKYIELYEELLNIHEM